MSLNNKTIAVVVPSYNESGQIEKVLESMPEFVDRIIVVNDCSEDDTLAIAKTYQNSQFIELMIPEAPIRTSDPMYRKADEIVERLNREEIAYFPEFETFHTKNDRIVILDLKKNSGVGSAIAVGYKWAKDHAIFCTAVMAGDGQMDPDELLSICEPVIYENVDYVKGNRLSHKSAKELIPRQRYLGNSILSIITKIASGYWHISDTQTGFTAISNNALNAINLYEIYPRYGMPNDMLVKLNIVNCTLKEIMIKPVYHVGEQSKMKIKKVIPRISWLLLKSFFKRLNSKYFKRSFHPLLILYYLGFTMLLVSIPFFIKILHHVIYGISANPVTVLAFIFLFISGFNGILFAMWMDIQDNERLNR